MCVHSKDVIKWFWSRRACICFLQKHLHVRDTVYEKLYPTTTEMVLVYSCWGKSNFLHKISLCYTDCRSDMYKSMEIYILQNTVVRIQNVYNVCLKITYCVNLQQIFVEMHVAFSDTARCESIDVIP